MTQFSLTHLPLLSHIYVCEMDQHWLNIVTCKKSLHVSALYNDALNGIDNHSGDSWIRSVRSLLCNHGFGEVWYNQGVGDPDLFLKLFRGRCFDIFKQNWQEQLKESPRARFYRAIKTNHCFLPYLKNINVKSHRIALTRLSVSSHKLHVETGRWERPVTSPDERYCRVCVNKIEDDFHFLVECDLYKEIRRRLIPKYFWARPSMYKVLELVTTEKSSFLKRLSKYVYLAAKIQQNVERPWIEVTLLDTLIWCYSQARCPELCIFLLWNVISSPGGRSWNRCPGTQSCLYAHKLMDDAHRELGHPWMKSADARSPHECTHDIPMGYTFSDPSSDHRDIPSPSSCQCYENLQCYLPFVKTTLGNFSCQSLPIDHCDCLLFLYISLVWARGLKCENKELELELDNGLSPIRRQAII